MVSPAAGLVVSGVLSGIGGLYSKIGTWRSPGVSDPEPEPVPVVIQEPQAKITSTQFVEIELSEGKK